MRGRSRDRGASKKTSGEPGRVTGSQGERMREREKGHGVGSTEQVKNDDGGERERKGGGRERGRWGKG